MLPPNSLYVALATALIFFSSLHTPAAAAATGGDTLAAGQVLAAGDKLVSRNGKFALGFFQFRQTLPGGSGSTDGTNRTVSSPGWYLGVWFNKIPVFTPVWIANRERPITESELKVAQLRISTDGNKLIITSTDDESTTIWSSADPVTNSTTNASSVHAVLMNIGNLALLPEAQSNAAPATTSSYLWQSFDYPTDVGLPGAKIGWSRLAGGDYLSRQFFSKKSLVDPSLGSYAINIDANGFMQLTTRTTPSVMQYWSWTPGRLDEFVTSLKALINLNPKTKGLLVPDYVDTTDELYFTYSITNESASVFAPQDITGQFKLMLWSETNQTWETIFSLPSDFCVTSAVCGPFTVCNGNSGPSPSSFCGCMETFSLTSPHDWELGDLTGGCARTTPLDCKTTSNRSSTSSGSTDVFHSIANVQLPYDPQTIEGTAAQSDCAEACLSNCNCTAYSYSNGKCSVWHGDLLNVDQADSNAINSQDVLYLRLAKSDFQSLNKTNRKTPTVVIAASVVGSGLVVLMLVFMIWRKRFRWCNAHSIQDGGGGGIIVFKCTDLCRATKNFSERLGGGGFGSLFKGALSDSTGIAVKRLDDARQRGHSFKKKRYNGNESNIVDILKGYDSMPKRYKYSELKKITGCFKHILGEGGYGIVYKGKLEDGRKVAVKLLKGSKGDGEEFLNEVVSIRRTSHINIVNLVGFCLHGSKRALIYDYLVNGSLDKYIYSEETKMALGWDKLREIAIGIARGLEYLHRGCNARIIHFDIKPHNVLLDENFCPKIADFGLAKLCHLKDSALSMSEARGTIGFIAPEVFSRGFGVVSTKSDVYSYGMVLLEMVVGRKNIKETTGNSSEAYFPDWIYDRLAKDFQSQDVACESDETARHMTLVALWCIQTSPGNRPSIRSVIEMLEKNISELEMPPKPFLSCPSPPSHFSS